MSEIPASGFVGHRHTVNRRWTFWALLFGLIVALLTPLPFLPALTNGFVNWDDPGLILENPHIRGIGWEQIRWMFSSFHMGPYQPLAWMSLALDYVIWGLEPQGFHLSSLIWHTANAVSFYGLVRRLLIVSISQAVSRPVLLGFCSAFSAILFSVHPLRVESVAWASERRDVLAAFFGIWTVWAYLKSVPSNDHDPRRIGWLAFSLLFHLLSLLSKASTIFVPAVLMVLDFYPLGRLNRVRWWITEPRERRVWVEKIPFWILSIGAGAAAFYGQYAAGGMASVQVYGLIDRLVLAAFSFAFYVWKTLIPVGLSPVYELPDQIHLGEVRFFLGIIGSLLATILLIRIRRSAPGPLAAWACYLILLLPVSGLVQTGAQLAADRYSYLPCLSFAVLLGGLFLRWLLQQVASGQRANVLKSAVVACSLVLGLLSWRQTNLWHDSVTLWRHALAVDPTSAKALTNLGCAMAEQGQFGSAREFLEKAIQIRPRSPYAQMNLGIVLRRLGEGDLAIQHYMEAWKWSSGSLDIAYNLGSLYQAKKNWPQAVAWYERALAIRPDWPQTLAAMGTAYAAIGELEAAVVYLERAIRFDPSNADAHNSLGIVLRRLGKSDVAAEHFLKAWELQPGSPDICYNLGYLYLHQENWSSAAQWFKRALANEPKHLKALNDLGIVHKKLGQIEKAVEWYREALVIDPDNIEPRYNLALALTDQGLDEEAIGEYRRVLKLDRFHVSAAHNLAVLLVRNKSFAQAEQVLREALEATDHPVLLQKLGWLLATSPDANVRNGTKAVQFAQRLVERTKANPLAMDTLAAAYAEIGRFDQAVEAATQAIQLADQQQLFDLADEIRDRCDLYRASKAYRTDNN